MDLVRWVENRPIARDFDELANKMFESFFGDGGQRLLTRAVPAFNLYREGENLIIEAQTPGYDKKDIDIELEDNILTIKGKHEEETKREEKDYVYREFQTGSFSRSIRLPENIKSEDLKVKYQDGVLKISVPVPKEEVKKGQKITID
jgi:HSP20 family protein